MYNCHVHTMCLPSQVNIPRQILIGAKKIVQKEKHCICLNIPKLNYYMSYATQFIKQTSHIYYRRFCLGPPPFPLASKSVELAFDIDVVLEQIDIVTGVWCT